MRTIHFGIIFFTLLSVFGGGSLSARAESLIREEAVLIEVFERKDCGHCRAEREFLTSLQGERTDIRVVFHDIEEPYAKDLFSRLTEKEGLPKATPVTLIGTHLLQGFGSAETTGRQMIKLVDETRGSPELGAEAFLLGDRKASLEAAGAVCDATTGICTMPKREFLVSVPFFGTLNAYALSLPVMASVLGFIDGFNPCAMWVLVTFLLVLIQLKSRERMFQVAGLFIFAEAIMYYLILNVWFTTWDFVGLDRFVTPAIGLLAMGGGLFFLYEWKYSDGTCQIVNPEKRISIISKVKRLAHEPLTWASVAGIVMLAFSVNVIEFACSIGIPQAFTKILELNEIGRIGEQTLMALYILFYMVDDILVFGLALWGAEKLHLTERYSRFSNLIGGLLMLLLGLLLIFRPELLRFASL